MPAGYPREREEREKREKREEREKRERRDRRERRDGQRQKGLLTRIKADEKSKDKSG